MSQPEGGRRFTSQPDQRPTRRYEPEPAATGTSHTSRRFNVVLDIRKSDGWKVVRVDIDDGPDATVRHLRFARDADLSEQIDQLVLTIVTDVHR